MTDTGGVTAVLPASGPPDAITRTAARTGAPDFLPVLLEVVSGGTLAGETRARGGSPREGQTEIPADPEGAEEATAAADETIALRELTTGPPVPSVDLAVLLFALAPPPLVSTEITAAPAISAATVAPRNDVASIEVASTPDQRLAMALASPATGAKTARPAMEGAPARVPGPFPDPAAIGHEVAAAPEALAAAREASKAPSADAPRADAALPPPDAAPRELRSEPRAGTASGVTAATDIRSQGTLIQEVAAAGQAAPSAHDEGRDRTRDGDTIRPATDGGIAAPTGVAEPRAALGVEAPQAPEAAAPRPVVEQIAQRVSLIAREGRHEVSMRLDPPELGALRIDAVMTGGQLTLEIRTEAEPTRDLLEQTLPKLREALAQHGITAERVTVQVGLDSGPREFGRDGGGDAYRPLPQVARSAAPPPRSAPAAPTWRNAVVDGFEVWA